MISYPRVGISIGIYIIGMPIGILVCFGLREVVDIGCRDGHVIATIDVVVAASTTV